MEKIWTKGYIYIRIESLLHLSKFLHLWQMEIITDSVATCPFWFDKSLYGDTKVTSRQHTSRWSFNEHEERAGGSNDFAPIYANLTD